MSLDSKVKLKDNSQNKRQKEKSHKTMIPKEDNKNKETQNISDSNIDKVIGIIETLENDLKQSVHKDQPGSFFERRNNKTGKIASIPGIKNKHEKESKSKPKKMLPDVSFENDTISTSSRVYEQKSKKMEDNEDDKRSNTPFRIKAKKNPKNKTGSNLPPVPPNKKL